MVDGWRNRFMAPVYAFVISFLFVLILGAALNAPNVPTTPNAPAPTTPNVSTEIWFVIAGQSELPEVFKDFRVRVEAVDDKRQLADVPVDRSGKFSLSTPDGEIQICAKLPDGWSAKDATVDPNTGVSCSTRRSAPGVVVEIPLVRVEIPPGQVEIPPVQEVR